MKPLYDRYRLVKQILCRASTIPVIVSTTFSQPSSTAARFVPPPPLLLYDERAAKITTLSERLQTLNPSSCWLYRLLLWERAAVVSSQTCHPPSSVQLEPLSESPLSRKAAHSSAGGRLRSQDVTS